MARWTKARIDALGRPLMKWDICDECGDPVLGHVWRADRAELVCVKVPGQQIGADDYRKAIEQQELEELNTRRREKLAQLQKLLEDSRRPKREIRDTTPGFDAQRAYFDEE